MTTDDSRINGRWTLMETMNGSSSRLKSQRIVVQSIVSVQNWKFGKDLLLLGEFIVIIRICRCVVDMAAMITSLKVLLI